MIRSHDWLKQNIQHPQCERSRVLPLAISLVHNFLSSQPLNLLISQLQLSQSHNLLTSWSSWFPDSLISRLPYFTIPLLQPVFVPWFLYSITASLLTLTSLVLNLPTSQFLYFSIFLSLAVSLSFFPVSLLLWLPCELCRCWDQWVVWGQK